MADNQPQSLIESAKDALSNAAEKAGEMAQYATGAVFSSNADSNVKDVTAVDETTAEPVQEKALKQPCKLFTKRLSNIFNPLYFKNNYDFLYLYLNGPLVN